MKRTSASWLTAVLTAAVVALPGVPAAAAAELPDLRVAWDPGAGTVGPQGGLPGMIVNNRGPVAATGVTVTVDLTSVDDRVRVTVADDHPFCALAGRIATCELGTFEPDSGRSLLTVTLTAAPDASPGAAGELVARVAGDQDDADPATDTSRTPVRIVTGTEPRPRPVVLIADPSTAAHRVGPGDRRPVYAAVRNDGDAPMDEFRVSMHLPLGAAVVERYRDCTYGSPFPDGDGGAFAYSPTDVECHLSLTLPPGRTLPLFDPATGAALFHARFGHNLPGPDELQGRFDANPEDDPGRPDNGTGPSFAAAVRKLPVLAGGSLPGLRGDQSVATFPVFTRPNRFDITLTPPEFYDRADDIVGFQFHLVDNGPSDGGAVEYVVTAPKGTVLTQSGLGECHTQGVPGSLLPESAALVCRTPAPFPSVHARAMPQLRHFFLRIKSAPGGGGRITVRGVGVGSTETKWSNNTVPLVLRLPAVPGGGGGGGGLPITGAAAGPLAAAGAGVALLGLVLLLAARRRGRAVTTGRRPPRRA